MKKLYILLLVFFLGGSCKKDSYNISLPPATMTGANIMGFLYDGKIWESISQKPGIFYTSLTVDTLISCKFYYDTVNVYRPLQIHGGMFIKDNNLNILSNSHIDIGLKGIFQINNTISFDTLLKGNGVVFSDYLKYKFYTNYQNSFRLTLTKIDTVDKVISGSFEGTLFTASPDQSNLNQNIFNLSDSIVLSSGRFDIKYTSF